MAIPVSAALSMLTHAASEKRDWQRRVDKHREDYEASIVARERSSDAYGFARGELWSAVEASLGPDVSPQEVKDAFNDIVAQVENV